MPARREPFDVRLSADTRDELARWLARELDKAEAARSVSDIEIAYWHTLYEQGRTRSARTSPWPDAADLTSAITTEKVDALRSRVVKTIFVDPVFTVEGRRRTHWAAFAALGQSHVRAGRRGGLGSRPCAQADPEA